MLGAAVGEQVDRLGADAGRWPPLTSTQRGPYASTAAAASRIAGLAGDDDAGELGDLVQVGGQHGGAAGSSRVRTTSTASAASSGSPCLETPTGSTTTGTPRVESGEQVGDGAGQRGGGEHAGLDRLHPDVVDDRAELRAYRLRGSSHAPWTPREFCAVTAVTTLMPCTPSASIVLRSA